MSLIEERLNALLKRTDKPEQQIAAKGDRKIINGVEYRSIGIDPRAVKPDDPEAGTIEDHNIMEDTDISDHTGRRFQIWRKVKDFRGS